MKIAIWHNLPSGGAKRALYYHVKGLLARGHVVEAWCPPTADQSYLPLSSFMVEHIVPMNWQPPQPPGNLISRGFAAYSNSRGLIGAMKQHCRQCAREINQGKFDLLMANACMFLRVSSIGKFVVLPKALYLPEPNRRLYEATPQLPWVAPPPLDSWIRLPSYAINSVVDMFRMRKLRLLAREEVTNAQAFDTILVNSLFSRESILRAYGLNAKVCYLGVDTELFKNLERPRQDVVVGVGTITQAKNIPFVIQALAKVEKPAPCLVWVGNYADLAYLEELRRLATSCGVDFDVRVGVEDSELVDILNRGMMMLYAPRLEPFGLVPLEANACGLPVIAVVEGGVRESVIDGVNGIIVEENPGAMAHAINLLRRDQTYARKLGENGRAWVKEKWSLDSAIDRLEQRFSETLETVRQRPTNTSGMNTR